MKYNNRSSFNKDLCKFNLIQDKLDLHEFDANQIRVDMSRYLFSIKNSHFFVQEFHHTIINKQKAIIHQGRRNSIKTSALIFYLSTYHC